MMTTVAMKNSNANSPRMREASWRWVRFAVGGLLLVAAGLKAFSPGESVLLQQAYHLPRWAPLVAVQAEIVVGLFLLSGLLPNVTRRVAQALFVLFAAFSFYRATGGAESCGCFGVIQVHPWWTFALDAAVLAALSFSKPPHGLNQSSTNTAAIVATGFVALGATCLVAMVAGSGERAADADNPLLKDIGGLTLLDPEEWIGAPFPLGAHILPAQPFSDGDWTVVLYHHDCPKCQEALPEYEALASGADESQGASMLLVETPPYGPNDVPRTGADIYARLTDERQWFVEAPVEIRVRDSVVASASRELPSIWRESD